MPYMVHTVCTGSRKGSVNVSMNDLSHVASCVEAVYMYGERKNWKLAHSDFLQLKISNQLKKVRPAPFYPLGLWYIKNQKSW